MILYFVRHGQTDFNKIHRIQGVQFDEPLNDEGVHAMEALLTELPKDFGVIFSSPLKRVAASAEIISRHTGKPVVMSNNLSEKDFGSLAGKLWDEIPNGEELHKKDGLIEYDYRPYGGESVADVEKRFRSFLDEARSIDKTALVVTSIGIIRLAYKVLLGKTGVTDVKNASVHTFEI
jgi:alpha-ribazole phosphatase